MSFLSKYYKQENKDLVNRSINVQSQIFLLQRTIFKSLYKILKMAKSMIFTLLDSKERNLEL